MENTLNQALYFNYLIGSFYWFCPNFPLGRDNWAAFRNITRSR